MCKDFRGNDGKKNGMDFKGIEVADKMKKALSEIVKQGLLNFKIN